MRTPLNAIVNYLEIALESPLDSETREYLARSHSASKSLIYVINDLLDLTRTEAGQDLVKEEVFDLQKVLLEATEMFRMDSGRKGLSFEVIEYPGLPPLVKGDPTRLRQALSNITANAVKYTTKGGLKIEAWTGERHDGSCEIEIAIEDTGEGISPGKLDMLFGELEQIHTEDGVELTGAGMEDASTDGQKMLGLGLAVVARNIRNMKGQLRLKSEEGKGSRFTLRLPFKLPPDQVRKDVAGELGGGPPAQGEVALMQPPAKLQRPSPTGYFAVWPGSSSIPNSPLSRPALPARSDGPPLGAPGSEGMSLSTSAFTTTASTNAMRPGGLNCDGVPVPSGAIVSLPRAAEPVSGVQEATALGDSSGFAVLVAEDDPINSKIMKKRLERMGHVVTLTVNGEECYEKFSSCRADYDVILMDMQVSFTIACGSISGY